MSTHRTRRRSTIGIAVATIAAFVVPLSLHAFAQGTAHVAAVGSAQQFASTSSAAPSTALPAGVQAGNLLVAFVETPAASKVTCAAGWTTRFNTVNGTTTRLVACTKLAGASEARPSATVAPASDVAMVTLAFSGVDPTQPVATANAVGGLLSPTVTVSRANSMVALAQGSAHVRMQFVPPVGATLATRANDGKSAELATASRALTSAAQVGTGRWTHRVTTKVAPGFSSAAAGNASSVVGVVLVNPAASAPASTTAASTTTLLKTTTTTAQRTGGAAPTTPPAVVCGNASILDGPATAPAGAVTVPAGNNGSMSWAANTTYWFAPGVHTLGTGIYNQIIPANNDTFVGGPDAILDGQSKNNYAFTQHATNVTISHLTIRNFTSPLDEGVVNHDSGNGWTISSNSIIDNDGAALMAGANNTIRDNCLADNGQYAINAYQSGDGITNLVVDHNEIAVNNTGNWEVEQPGCGCTGGMKLWAVNGAEITDNYVHDNRSVGIWADTDNRAIEISGNYIANNDAEGIFYETSYNASIHDNTLIRNGLVKGPTNPGFPTGAIYISESGGDSRVAGGKFATMEIADNVLTDNWSGVVLWENADRFCGSPANTSSGYCTLVDPLATTTTCTAAHIVAAPFFGDCRWKTQNITVAGNRFSVNPAAIKGCAANTGCGYNGVFSNWGSYPSWSPYIGAVVEDALTYHQHDVFSHNVYNGPWHFMAHDQSSSLSFAAWQAAPTSQDAGSTATP